jgi:hypothetical protein
VTEWLVPIGQICAFLAGIIAFGRAVVPFFKKI